MNLLKYIARELFNLICWLFLGVVGLLVAGGIVVIVIYYFKAILIIALAIVMIENIKTYTDKLKKKIR